MFINHIKVHKTMLADCKMKEEVITARSLFLSKRNDIAALTVDDPVVNQVKIEKLAVTNRELTETFTPYKDTRLTTLRSFFHQHWP